MAAAGGATRAIDPRVAELLRRPQLAQRTPEWYEARRTLITASDCAAALGIKPYASYKTCPRKDLLQKKLDNRPLHNIFVEHGTLYEDEARDLAMAKLGMQALDLGLLRHPTLPWLGASPDGVTTCGKCIEIKCPLRRKIVPGEVPHHYFPQVQVQMQVCGLRETVFIQYKPSTVTRGEPELDIAWLRRDDEWFERAKPVLKSFFDEYQAALETHVPAPLPPPPPCLIDEQLYAEMDA